MCANVGTFSILNVSSLIGYTPITISTFSTLAVSSITANLGTISTLNVSYLTGYTPGFSLTGIIGNVSTLAGGGSGTGVGTGNNSGIGTAARFNKPLGVAVDSAGNIYVTDNYNNLIRKIAPGGAVSILAGGINTIGHIDATGTNATFNSPYGIALDSTGNVYIAEGPYNGVSANHSIRKITPGGVVTTLAGGGAAGNQNGYVDSSGTNALFSSPLGVAVDSGGNVFVADNTNNLIRKITPGGVVTTFAGGNGGTAQGYADGIGTSALFFAPVSIGIDSSDNLYVGDNNSNIRKITPGAIVTTLAANTASILNFYASGITVDPSNNIYVSAFNLNKIFRIPFGKNITTLAGGGATGEQSGYVNNIGTNALFYNPYGIAIDSGGNIYIADTMNNLIRISVPKNITYGQPLLLYGNVGVNCNTPQYALDVAGDIHASGTITGSSDRRLKINIETINGALDKISSLTGVYYNRNDQMDSSTLHMGLIAQDVEQVIPEVVMTDSSEYKMKSVAYGNIVAVLIEGIKELTARVGSLQAQVSTLQG